MNEKTINVESIEDQKERMDYDIKILNATDDMINRDPYFWEKIDQWKRGSRTGIQWLK